MRERMGRVVIGAVVGIVALASLAAGAGAATKTVSVDDNFFKPKRLTVTVGDKVTWRWDGFVAHNVRVEKGPQKFGSKTKSDGKFSRVITKPGVYRIVCTLHPGMTMRLTATPAVAPTTTTTPSTPPPS
jgi:plastocyanin